MNNHTLESTSEERDIGVIIDETLKFHRHTATAVKKANTVLGIIKKSFITLDTQTLPLLYKSMVRPHLEYGNVFWGPHYKSDQQMLEKVQKRATKLVSDIGQAAITTIEVTITVAQAKERRHVGNLQDYHK